MMLSDILSQYRIILASASPRRQVLLKGLDIQFEVIVREGVSEQFPETLKAERIAEYLAEEKSNAYTDLLNDKTLIITADTIVWLDDSVLNKPVDRQDAIRMLGQLSGRKHQVFTGVTLRTGKAIHTFSACSDVWFTKLSEEEIAYYVDNYRPYDKAGAYGAQDWIGYVAIERIEGSYFNVMGLPVQKLYHELLSFIRNNNNK